MKDREVFILEDMPGVITILSGETVVLRDKLELELMELANSMTIMILKMVWQLLILAGKENPGPTVNMVNTI